MIKLIDLLDQEYKFLLGNVPDLEVGEYEVKKYYIFDDPKFMKTIFFDTDKGMYKTKSWAMIRTLYGSLGAILQKQFDKGETVFIEFVNKRNVNGRYGLGFRII